MANKIGLFDNLNTDFYIGGTKARIYLGDTLVYPMEQPKTNVMFKRVHKDGTIFEVECGESGTTLTSAITLTNTTFSEISGTTNPVTAITIGDCVEEIGVGAFLGFSKVNNELVIPDSVTTIGRMAFRFSSGFTGNLVISDNVTEIGDSAFSYCRGFDGTLTLPSGLTIIDVGTFQNCSGFTGNLVIPDNVTEIRYNAFSECRRFNGTLTLPNWLTSIGYQAFYNCIGFTGELIIPSGVTTIGFSAFANCSGFSSIYIKSEIPASFGTNIFYNTTCPIYVPCGTSDAYKTATNFSIYADRIQEWDFDKNSECQNNDDEEKEEYPFSFYRYSPRINSAYTINCDSTSAMTITSSNTNSGLAATDYSGSTMTDKTPTKVIVGDCCSKIGDNVGYRYNRLNTLKISENVSDIGKYAFANCTRLNTSIKLGKDITNIGDYAFWYLKSIKDITIKASTPPTITNNIGFSGNSATIYVPKASVSKYKSATNWSRFANRIKAIGEDYDYSVTTVCNENLTGSTPYTTYDTTVINKSIGGTSVAYFDRVYVGDKVTKIDSTAGVSFANYLFFSENSQLEEIATSGICNSDLVEFTAPKTLKTVGASFLSGMDDLEFVDLSKCQIETIPNDSFKWMYIAREIRLPKTLKTIGTNFLSGALVNTYGETGEYCNIYIEAETPPQLSSSLPAANIGALYVPCGTAEAYKTATNWSALASKIIEWDFDNDSECVVVENLDFTYSAITVNGDTVVENDKDTNKIELYGTDYTSIRTGNFMDGINYIQYNYNLKEMTIEENGKTIFIGYDGNIPISNGIVGNFNLERMIINNENVINISLYNSLKEFIIKSKNPPSLTSPDRCECDIDLDSLEDDYTCCFFTDECKVYVPDESVEKYKTATNWNLFADNIYPLSQYGK